MAAEKTYAVEILVPCTRTVYIDATSKTNARVAAKTGDWFDADPINEDASGRFGVRVLGVRETES
jgi:hypothetical protein